jgi:hypothetical protein
MKSKGKFEKHGILPRQNSEENPLVLPGATWLLQPNGLPFNAQCAINLNQAKFLIKIIERLQEPIKETVANERLRKQPEQLELFKSEESDNLQFEFEMSDLGILPVHYKRMCDDIVKLMNYTVQEDVIVFSEIANKSVEAIKYNNLLTSVTIPKKYERFIKFTMDKNVAKKFASISDVGFTKYLLEIAMKSNSKYTLLIYQLISQWKDKGGFSWSIDNLKKKLGLVGKYSKLSDFNRNVIMPAYIELHENADVWFEYDFDNKNDKPFINIKIIRGYFKVNTNNYLLIQPEEITYQIEKESLSSKQLECLSILKHQLLFNNDDIILEIIDTRCNDFFIWWNASKEKINKMDNPAAILISYLKMTKKHGWKLKKYEFIEETQTVREDELLLDIWNNLLNSIEQQLGRYVIDTWLSSSKLVEANKKQYIVLVPSKYVMEQLEKEGISASICATLNQITGYSGMLYYRVMPT